MTDQFRSVFDIIGPVMVGPSSSHTAGAARIGKMVRTIFSKEPKIIDIYLYESFAKTYRGHGTDIALVGGLLGMEPDDDHLSESLKIAHEKGIEVFFIPQKEAAQHPNQVKIVVSDEDDQLSVTGISIGGGNIQITEINDVPVQFAIGQPTFLILYKDVPGIVAQVSRQLADEQFNIATMNVHRDGVGQDALMVIEVDQPEAERMVDLLKQISNVKSVHFFH